MKTHNGQILKYKSVCLSVSPPVCLTLCPRGINGFTLQVFLLNLVFEGFSKCVEKISLKSDNNNVYYRNTYVHLY